MGLFWAKPTEHAIRALIYLAMQEEPRLVTINEIAEAESISASHLAKVMKNLVRNKVVDAVRGPGGGFRLTRNPEELNLWELLGMFGEQGVFNECAIGWSKCEDDNPCPLHEQWVELREQNRRYLERVTISDLALAALAKDKESFPKFFTI